MKTRLSPPLSKAMAARLYAAFVSDLAREVAGIADEHVLLLAGVPPDIHLDRPDAPSALRAALPADFAEWPDWPVRAQRGADLGERLAAALADLGAGARRVVLLGADHPDLPPAEVAAAFVALEEADVVLGPTMDGGYYLIGSSRPSPDILAAMPWSSPELLRRTLDRAAALGLTVRATRPWYDVDRPEDLAFLEQNLRLMALSGRVRLPATAAVLGECAR